MAFGAGLDVFGDGIAQSVEKYYGDEQPPPTAGGDAHEDRRGDVLA